MAFTRKYIEVDFSLAQGVFTGGGNAYTAKGLRISAQIVKAGGLSKGQAAVAIYGLPLSVMNQLSTYGQTLTLQGRNTITVKAGDDPSNLATVYVGDIFNAYMDGQSQPNVPFRVDASVVAYAANVPVPPTSQPGSSDVGDLLGQMAKAANLQFENNGISTKIMNPYYPGTAIQQIDALCEHAGLEHIIDNGTLAVWKAGSARQGSGATVSPSTGMVGYPRFNAQGIDITAEFQPTFVFGQNIKVESSITPAQGTWIIYYLEYDLECETPNGRWFCNILAHKPGQMPVV